MQRADRKRKQRIETENARIRTSTWGFKRLRSWWGKLMRSAKARGDEKAVAALEVRRHGELAKVKGRLTRLLEARDKTRLEALKGDEFRRYRHYMEKCERALKRLTHRGEKYIHHRSEIDRCKAILFGSIVSPPPIA